MLNISTLTREENRVLDEFKKRLLKRLSNQVMLIRLFGSKARGDVRKESDIDVLVVLKKRDRRAEEKVYGVVQDILFDYGLELSVITFYLREFMRLKKASTIFMQLIERDGVDLWKAA